MEGSMEPFYDTCFMCFCLGTKTDVYEGNGETEKSCRGFAISDGVMR
jgi:hypothetical protein